MKHYQIYFIKNKVQVKQKKLPKKAAPYLIYAPRSSKSKHELVFNSFFKHLHEKTIGNKLTIAFYKKG